MSKFLKLIKNEKGATAIEYGLIAALIAVAAIGAMSSVGSSWARRSTTFQQRSRYLIKFSIASERRRRKAPPFSYLTIVSWLILRNLQS